MEVTVTKTCLEVLNNLAKVGSREGGFIVIIKIWEYEIGLIELQNTFKEIFICYNFIILLNFYINCFFSDGGIREP